MLMFLHIIFFWGGGTRLGLLGRVTLLGIIEELSSKRWETESQVWKLPTTIDAISRIFEFLGRTAQALTVDHCPLIILTATWAVSFHIVG